MFSIGEGRGGHFLFITFWGPGFGLKDPMSLNLPSVHPSFSLSVLPSESFHNFRIGSQVLLSVHPSNCPKVVGNCSLNFSLNFSKFFLILLQVHLGLCLTKSDFFGKIHFRQKLPKMGCWYF